MLRSLSSRFENQTGSLEAQLNSLTIEDLQARICREDARQRTVEEIHAKALPAQSSGTKRRYAASQRKNPLKCFYFKNQGHKIADYCKRIRVEEGKINNKQGASPHALTFGKLNGRSSICLVDSGASYHICSDGKLFTSIWERTMAVDVSIKDGSTLTANF